jgi:hypothetical protein
MHPRKDDKQLSIKQRITDIGIMLAFAVVLILAVGGLAYCQFFVDYSCDRFLPNLDRYEQCLDEHWQAEHGENFP